MGLLQVSQVFAAREVLYHAAARASRARTVGFNSWMVEKCMRVASIPNAGRILQPDDIPADPTLSNLMGASPTPGDFWSTVLITVPQSQLCQLEKARIPWYMATDTYPESRVVLDYENWDNNSINYSDTTQIGPIVNPQVEITVRQQYPLWVPLHETFYDAEHVDLRVTSRLENHYPLYLDE
jgi:hypothetical protein